MAAGEWISTRSMPPGVQRGLHRGCNPLSKIFGADLRSLALFRMVLAIIVLIDLFGRATFLRIHYTDAGLVPRDMLLASGRLNDWRWSVHLLGGTTLSQAVLFGFTGLAALALLFGYRTRLMTIIVWVMVVSVQARNPLVLNSADSLLRLLLFWSMFLPLGAWWSVDSRRITAPSRPGPHFASVATAGLFLQIAFMYWFTAILKTGDAWRSSGTALYYSLGAAQFATPFGEFLHQFEGLLRILTFGSFGIEVIAPILLFVPIFFGPLRTLGIALIVMLQLGIFLTLYIGFFPLLSAGCMVCLLPGWFWETAVPKIRAVFRRLIVSAGAMPASRLAHVRGAFRNPAAGHGFHWSMAGITVSVGDHSLAGRGSDEPVQGRASPASGSHMTEARSSPRLRSGPITNLVTTVCLIFVVAANIGTVSSFSVPGPVRPMGHALGLFQQWSMFAPSPGNSTYWYVIEGTLADGRTVDLLTPVIHDDFGTVRHVSWEQPEFIGKTVYRGEHWRKYLNSITFGRREERRAFAAYVCRTWNAQHAADSTLVSLQAFHMRRRILPNYQAAEAEPIVRFSYECSPRL